MSSHQSAIPANRMLAAVFAVMFTGLTLLFVSAAVPAQSASDATTAAVRPICASAPVIRVYQLFV